MGYETIKVERLAGALGAEISGVDLSKPLGNQTFQEVHDALVENQVIFFRDQDITPDRHKDFGRRFGSLHIHPAMGGIPGHPEILPLHSDAKKQYSANGWHSDVSCDPIPYLMEEGGGDGFQITPSYYAPDYFADLSNMLIPELQRRGVFREDYAPGTLRDRMNEDDAARAVRAA